MSKRTAVRAGVILAVAGLIAAPAHVYAADAASVTIEVDIGVCGDDRIGLSEDCEGSNLNGASCTTLGFDSGTLGCSIACDFDTSACANTESSDSGSSDDDASGESETASSTTTDNQKKKTTTGTKNKPTQNAVPVADFTQIPTRVSEFFSSPAAVTVPNNPQSPTVPTPSSLPPSAQQNRASETVAATPRPILQRIADVIVTAVQAVIKRVAAVVGAGSQSEEVTNEGSPSSRVAAPPVVEPESDAAVSGTSTSEAPLGQESIDQKATTTDPVPTSTKPTLMQRTMQAMHTIMDFFKRITSWLF